MARSPLLRACMLLVVAPLLTACAVTRSTTDRNKANTSSAASEGRVSRDSGALCEYDSPPETWKVFRSVLGEVQLSLPADATELVGQRELSTAEPLAAGVPAHSEQWRGGGGLRGWQLSVMEFSDPETRFRVPSGAESLTRCARPGLFRNDSTAVLWTFRIPNGISGATGTRDAFITVLEYSNAGRRSVLYATAERADDQRDLARSFAHAIATRE